MIKSMTGFGHAEKVTKQQKITVELKSVNHRYLDLNIKMPRKFNMLEGQVRNLMKQYMQRGKVDVLLPMRIIQEAMLPLNIIMIWQPLISAI